VVIIRLRDRDEVGSTFIRALERYERILQVGGNDLMLESMNDHVLKRLEKTELLDPIGRKNRFLGQTQFGAALRKALAAVEAWIQAQADDNEGGVEHG
jgi:SulP family sulfate permease